MAVGAQRARANGPRPYGLPAPAILPPPSNAPREYRSAPSQPLTIAELRHRLPGVLCWWGVWTHEWWALVQTSGDYRLVNATTVDGLARAITTALAE
ncbi:hypothetical protein [Actinomadura sp. 9N407]|uniref:hypothetical protein n=1 Tax=Actinomadura sp. 9N407 TaxID=3375154 RepID=UPI00378E46CA